MTEAIVVTEVRSGRDLRRFLGVPYHVYRNDSCWVPPLQHEIRKLLDRRRNPFFEHAEADYWIAWRGDRPVGRISAQINRLHLETHGDGTGNFGFLEAIDDHAVFEALVGTAGAWLKARGMARMLGPYSPSINDEIGVLVTGFDRPAVIGTAYSPRYYGARLEAAGCVKAKDVHALLFDMAGEDIREIDRLKRVTDRVNAAGRFHIRPIDMRCFETEMRNAIEVYNDAWSDNWGFVPVTRSEVKHLIASVRPIIDPKYVLMGEVDGKLEGIFMTLLNLNEAIADLGGRLAPFGWAKLLWRLHRRPFKSGRVMLAGVRKRHRNSLLSPALLSQMLARTIETGRASGIDWLELSWVLEDNARSMALCRRAGGRIYKTYRIYRKPLT
jgi:hypothetical protein